MVKDIKEVYKEETKVKVSENQTLVNRMSNGFKVLGLKLKNNEYLQNMVEAQNEKSNEEEEDVYATDFSKIGKVNF